MSRIHSSLLMTALLMGLAPTALASTTWYVDGVNGSDSCMSPATACKTIGRAITLASPGDSIMIAAATYKENLTIGKSLNLIGAGAQYHH
jgi:nitrous oxidase accessory protein NosD